VEVSDGDTILVSKNCEPVKVRMIGIDTPETVDPRKPVQCFGKEASDYTKKHLQGKSVVIETDAEQDTYDKYGRLLGYVILEDGTNFNKTLIEEGYAHEYTYQTPYRYQKEFKEAEQSARENQRGLWNLETCAGNTKS
jgi:micrococcal nuclease